MHDITEQGFFPTVCINISFSPSCYLGTWNIIRHKFSAADSDSTKLLDFQNKKDLSTRHDREQLSLSFPNKNKVSSTEQLSQTLDAIYLLTHTFIVYY